MHYLYIQKTINKVDKNFIFESEKLSYPISNPWTENIHIHLPHVHL